MFIKSQLGGGVNEPIHAVNPFEKYQNVASFCMSLFSLHQLYFAKDLNLAHHVISCHLFLDSFITVKPDILFHHACILILYAYNALNPVSREIETLLFAPLVTTEISTIFYALELILKPYIPRLYSHSISFVFLATFIYSRVYGLYANLLTSPEYWSALEQTRKKDIWFYGMYGTQIAFYGLNLYWFCLIMKKIVSAIIGKNKTDEMRRNRSIHASTLLQYAGIGHLAVGCLTSYNNPDANKMIDICGLTVLLIVNYLFHNMCANTLIQSGDVDYRKYPANFIYLIDNVGIRIRTIACIATFVLSRPHLYGYLHLTILHHASGLLKTIDLMMQETTPILYTDENNLTKQLMYGMIGLPIVCDALFIGGFSQNYFVAMVINLICIYLNNSLKPLYEYSHVSFHVLLAWQTYILCNIHKEM